MSTLAIGIILGWIWISAWLVYLASLFASHARTKRETNRIFDEAVQELSVFLEDIRRKQ